MVWLPVEIPRFKGPLNLTNSLVTAPPLAFDIFKEVSRLVAPKVAAKSPEPVTILLVTANVPGMVTAPPAVTLKRVDPPA